MPDQYQENKYYGDVGFLYPYDIRYNADDVAFCGPLPDGSVRFRLFTEHGFEEATLVYSDGTSRAVPMWRYAQDSRTLYWEATLSPVEPALTYYFALLRVDGKIVYYCRHGVDHSVEPLDRWHLDLDTARRAEAPQWMRGAVVYQIFPERFANGDPANDPPGTVPWGFPPRWTEFQGGDLQGITLHLDYLQDLGAEVLYLNPINTSPSNHKFDAVDFYHVDPAFGGDEALRELVDDLHRRGMRIILDASFNHCHPLFFAFQDVIENGPASLYWDWFTIYEYPIVVRYRPHLITKENRPRNEYLRWLADFAASTGITIEETDTGGPLLEPTYLAWYDVLDMPKLNQRNPQTRAYFLDVAAYWLREFRIDGWRMDVARHIEPDFWVDFRRICKAVKPDCVLLAEIWGNVSHWLQGDQFDAAMNYVFRDLCLAYYAQAEMDTCAFLDGITRMLSLYAPEVMGCCQNLLSSHDTERFRTAARGDVHRLLLATLFQMTIPGAPGIYYGDEIGMSGGTDPDCRRAFPWHRPETWDAELLQATRQLTRLRKRHPALRHGTWRALWADEEAFAYERTWQGERVVVLIVRGKRLTQVELPCHTDGPSVLWGEGKVQATEEGLLVQDIASWSGMIVKLG